MYSTLKKHPVQQQQTKFKNTKIQNHHALESWRQSKRNILNLEFHEPDGVDEEDKVLDEVAREGDDDKGPPSIRVRERAFKVNITMKDN